MKTHTTIGRTIRRAFSITRWLIIALAANAAVALYVKPCPMFPISIVRQKEVSS